MQYRIDFRNIDKDTRADLRNQIDERIAHLEKRISTFSNKDLRLHGAVQKHGGKELYRVGLSLHLPGRILSAEEEAENAVTAITEAFSELERQALRHKSRIRHEHLWKRKSRRRELHDSKAKTGTDATATSTSHAQPQDWFSKVEPCLDGLYDFARHEITYLQNLGDLSPTDIQPDELVDSVVVSAWERQAEKPDSIEFRAWLYQLAIEILDEEVRRHARREQDISLETVVSQGYDPDDDSIYEFYQPDEVLRVEDLIAVNDGSVEYQRHLPATLARLPRSWRRALLLRDLFDLSPDQIASALNQKLTDVEAAIAHAEQFITAHLGERDIAGLASVIEQPGVALKRLLRNGYPRQLHDELKRKFAR
ncbi:ribosomal subunit interface protein [Thiogranum longum]|uniref:Ribosomal subunit interface protein n=1 Tax=Thiogranum longum TaxID=1537524 RepID=A0A4R1HBI5_9GAMM|nr:HPF/RaiA family ribosome-associated protein [Thiogranum longum]TCK18758.1 ribosomal subunit interface protein [Thiogranum longum]